MRILAPLALALPLDSPAAANEENFNVWTGQFVIVDIDENKDCFVRAEAQERLTNDADRLGRLLLRGRVGYRIGKDVGIGGGNAYILTDPVGSVELNEHRFYQELNLRLIRTDSGVTLDSRARSEQRTFKEGDSALWSLRNFVQLRVPISENNKPVAYSEPFIELDETQFQRGAAGA